MKPRSQISLRSLHLGWELCPGSLNSPYYSSGTWPQDTCSSSGCSCIHAWSTSPSQRAVHTWRILCTRCVMTDAGHGEILTSYPSHEMPFHAPGGCIGLCSSWVSFLAHGNFGTAPSWCMGNFPTHHPVLYLGARSFCIHPSHTALVFLVQAVDIFLNLDSLTRCSLSPSCTCPWI